MALCLAIVSGKGGTGKSTVSTGLGIAFTNAGKKVLLIDADEGLRCLDLMLGVDGEIIFDLGDILEGKDISDAIYPIPSYPLLSLIPAPGKIGKIDAEKFFDFLQKVSPLYDVIIIDFPAGIDYPILSIPNEKIKFITVCNPDPVSVRDVAITSNVLSERGITTRLIINRFDIAPIKNGTYRNIDDIIDTSGIRLIGLIPETVELKLLPVTHTLKRNGRSVKSLKRITARLSGKEIKLPSLKKI